MLSHDMIQGFLYASFVTVTFTPEIRLLPRWENQPCLRQLKDSEPELKNTSSMTAFSWNPDLFVKCLLCSD